MAKIRLPDSAGHDIVIWQKSESTPTWAVGYSGKGIDYIQKFIPEYIGGKTELAGVFPDQFLDKAPENIKIGGVIPGTRKTITLHPRALH
jgi:hypothetical protein